jgi:hypothetical protein
VHALPLRRLRNLVLRVLNLIGPFKRALALGFSGIARRRFSVLPPAVVAPQRLPKRPVPVAAPRLARQARG